MGTMIHIQKKAPLVIHLHMPKTGGTTLKKIIKKNYPRSNVFDVYLDHQQLETRLQEIAEKDVKCLQGHMPFGVHHVFKQPSTYITLLRDPVDRIISEYYFIRSIPWHNSHLKVSKMSLEEYQESPMNQNLQTHYILGGKFGSPLSEEDFEQAKKNLETYFSVVGITDMFDESLFLLMKQFQWANTLYTKANVTKKRPAKHEISQETIEKIKENNRTDIKLYEFAKQRLTDRISSLDFLTKKHLKIFKKKINEYKQIH